MQARLITTAKIGLVGVLLAALAPVSALAWCIGAPLGPDGLPVVAPVLDVDGDGLNALQEAFLGTDPNDPDSDGDGIGDAFEVMGGVRNLDRPSLFSAERYADPNDPDNRQIVVLEGTNLFRGGRQLGAAWVSVEDTGRRRLVRQSLRGNNRNRIALRLPTARARRLLGGLPSKLFVRTFGRRTTNRLELQPTDIECSSPKLMGAALVRLHAEIDGGFRTFEYIGIGGCGLVERLNLREVSTTIVLSTHGLPIDGEYRFRIAGAGRGVPLIGSRILTPVRPLIVADSLNPIPAGMDELRVGDTLSIVRGSDATVPEEVIFVDGLTADLTIPESNLWADHDGDGIPSAIEIREGTDPLVYDTDRDGLHDGVERRLASFDANDPDTDDDGILDGDELPDIMPTQPLRFWNPRRRGARRHRPARIRRR